jgi:hypothetical protein
MPAYEAQFQEPPIKIYDDYTPFNPVFTFGPRLDCDRNLLDVSDRVKKGDRRNKNLIADRPEYRDIKFKNDLEDD